MRVRCQMVYLFARSDIWRSPSLALSSHSQRRAGAHLLHCVNHGEVAVALRGRYLRLHAAKGLAAPDHLHKHLVHLFVPSLKCKQIRE